jgi:peptidoglycan/xylan/chitin deacetylase (PgdA/CDA1 family)
MERVYQSTMKDSHLGVKVDIDTYRGMEAGVPGLIRIFSRRRIWASFFISMGPDNSGKAVFRFFTRRGFLKKMLRSNAVGMYGLRTALSGTLLPARQIARSFPGHFRTITAEGHEAGIHGYDHVRWHDRLASMSSEQTREEMEKARALFREITGREPESSAAPGWTCTPQQLAIQDGLPMLYHSDSRGECPFFPVISGHHFNHLQVPTTLPTLDELLGSGRCREPEEATRFYLERIIEKASSVLTVHAEAEGMGWAEWFDHLLGALAAKGVSFVRLRDIAATAVADPGSIPHCELRMGELPGRAGPVAVQGDILPN